MTAGVAAVHAVGEVIALVAFVTNVLFVVVYSLLGPWWDTELGRNIVAMDSALALALLPAVLHDLFGWTTATSVGFGWFVDAALGCVPVIVVWRLVILVRLDPHPWWRKERQDQDPR